MAKQGSRKYHDRVARQYDAIYDNDYWRFHDELTWRAVKPHLPADLSTPCLDLGCGTGKWGLKLLKSGYAVTFVDHSAAMVEQVRAKLNAMPTARAQRGTLLVTDIVSMPELAEASFGLTLAMGDPLSICSDPQAAANQMYRACKPGGIVIATADNLLAALDHYADKGSLDAMEQFINSTHTQWLTADTREQFELTTFTPHSLSRLFERSGFTVLDVRGKTVLPVRKNLRLMEGENAMERLLALEEKLAKDPASAGRCGHLQIVARRG